MSNPEQIPTFTIKEPIFKSSCDFYLFYPTETIIPKHKDLNEAHTSYGQVVKKKDEENSYILWVSSDADSGTLEHECIHLAGEVMEHMGAFPGSADDMEAMIRVFDYYYGEAKRRV